MEVNALDMHDQYAARQLVVNREALHQFGIDRDRGAAVDAQRFSDARNKEKKCDARVAHDVPKAVDTVVPGAVGDRECRMIENAYKTRCIALGRAVETFWT